MDRRNVNARPIDQIRRNTAETLYLINDALLAADIIAGTLFGHITANLYFHYVLHLSPGPVDGLLVWRELVLVSVIAALVVRKADYRPHAERIDVLPVLASVIGRAVYAAIILITVGLVTKSLHEFPLVWIASWAACFLLWMLGSRFILLMYRQHVAQQGAWREAIAVLGTPVSTGAIVAQLGADAHVVGVFERSDDSQPDIVEMLTEIVTLARSGAIGLVVLAMGKQEQQDTAGQIVDYLKGVPVRVAICTDVAGLAIASQELLTISGIPMKLVAGRPLSCHGQIAKLMMDKFGAAVLLALTGPLLAAVAIAIMSETRGPIIFRQLRTGWYGRLFTVYKFRTMQHTPGETPRRQTCRGDPRCTRVGAFLRRTSLDELPQLWNVLIGDMSLVGPRPHADALHNNERCSSFAPVRYEQRQRVKPGLTGWAQVHGLRGAADTPEKLRKRIELDLYYIDHWSIWLDLRILARTPWVVLSAENAY